MGGKEDVNRNKQKAPPAMPLFDRRLFNRKTPLFQIEHFNQPCSSGYKGRSNTSFVSHGKRKSSYESTFHPVTKQQITEARIASSMQRLTLNNNFAAQTGNRVSDEGFFEDIAECDSDADDDIDSELDLTEGSNKPKIPQFKLANGVKESFSQIQNNIFPQNILQSITQHCLAVVPYRPPDNMVLSMHDGAITVSKEESEQLCKVAIENDERMNISGRIYHDDAMME